MKTLRLILIVLLVAIAVGGQAQPVPQHPPMMPMPGMPPQRMLPNMPMPDRPPSGMPNAAPARPPVNYLVRVEWKDAKDASKFLEVLTAEGHFNLDTIEKNSVKIGNSEVPVTLKFQGTLTSLNDEQGKLDLFLGRTVPYVTGTFGSGPSASSSYSQMQVGLSSSFIITFGKPLVIQNDDNGPVSVLVQREKD